MLNTGTIYGINGPVIYLKGNTGFRMSEMVYVGKQKFVIFVLDLRFKRMVHQNITRTDYRAHPADKIFRTHRKLRPGFFFQLRTFKTQIQDE